MRTQGTDLPHVLHVIAGLNTGGAEVVLCELLAALRPPGFEHTVVCLGSPGSLSPRVADVAALTHLCMKRGRATPADFLRLRRVLRNESPDLIQGWMFHGNVMASLAAIGDRTPIIWSIHHTLGNLRAEKRRTRMVIRAGAVLSRLPQRIVYCAQASARDHEQLGYERSRSQVIPNGFDTSKFKPDERARHAVRAELEIGVDQVAIGVIARAHPMKDHANFLKAAALFRAKAPGTVFVLVGDGVDENNDELMTLIDTMDLRSAVRLCGRRGDIVAVNNALDIASSSSSRGEAFPMALGEAMACGTPCVATDVGDVRTILGDTGVVVPPGDPAALSDGWHGLVAMGKAARVTLGARARERIVTNFGLARTAGAYAAVYAELLKRRRYRRGGDV